MNKEKRAFKRLAFSKDSEIKAILVSLEGESEVTAKVLNVSQGGIGLAAERSEREKIKEEVEFLLETVSGGTGLPCLAGQKVRIKWILNYEPLDNLGIGCEFVNLNAECIAEINALFIEQN